MSARCGRISGFGECDRPKKHEGRIHATAIGGGSDPISDPALWFLWVKPDRAIGYRVAALTTSDIAHGLRADLKAAS